MQDLLLQKFRSDHERSQKALECLINTRFKQGIRIGIGIGIGISIGAYIFYSIYIPD